MAELKPVEIHPWAPYRRRSPVRALQVSHATVGALVSTGWRVEPAGDGNRGIRATFTGDDDTSASIVATQGQWIVFENEKFDVYPSDTFAREFQRHRKTKDGSEEEA